MSQKRLQLEGSSSGYEGNLKRLQLEGSSSGYEGNLEATDSPADKRRRVPSFRNEVQDAMRLRSVQHLWEPLEPLIRRVVKEEVELALRKHINFKRSSGKDIYPPKSRSLRLKFLSILSLPVFTGTRIEGEDGSAIKVALIDTFLEKIVLSAPESSAKLEIVVLEGDFDSNEREDWTKEEFNNNIVKEREGKKPLLTGDVHLTLKDGIGCMGEISFTDNSSWTRSRRFRLGARVVGNSDRARVKEAKTVSFIVRDHRGELYKKHYPPSLSDEVWRLEKIGKDGAFHKRLCRDCVKTVKDFLILLHLDPTRLRNILGSGMSTKMWEATIEHAQTCVLDTNVYLYYNPDAKWRNGVAFNIVGKLMGLVSDGQFIPVEKPSENEKLDASKLVISAFQNWAQVISFENEESLVGSILLVPSNCMTDSSRADTSDGSKIVAFEKMTELDFTQPSVSSPDMSSLYSLVCASSSDNFALQTTDNLDLSFDQPLNLPPQVPNSIICDTESVTQAFCDDESLGGFLDDISIRSHLHPRTDMNSTLGGISRPHPAVITVRPSKRWRLLSSVLQWFFLLRVVSRRAQTESMPRYY